MGRTGGSVLEDVIDGFWEHPFGFLVHQRHREDLIDVFAGRIFEHQPSGGVQSFRRLLKQERGHEVGGEYSVPIGSRFHPERAPLWEEEAPSLEELRRFLGS
jgi:hypothetical protein